MIPLRLDIDNFLSYRETTSLDFHGLHLACISGPNGAGKSSILDAITWVLFGRSRSKSDDDVINRQALRKGDGALVDFSFELEGGTYRVIRGKRQGRSTTLDFQMATPDGGWKSLSEAGVRGTQAAIESLLKMNFDVFINASFLLQGKADEFTTKTANKRKEILADLLGVNEWDRYKEAAGLRRKEVQNRLLLLDGRMEEIDVELAERPAREAALAAAGEALALINEQLQLHEQILTERRRIETAVEQQRRTISALAKNRDDTQRSLTELERMLAKRSEERDRLRELAEQADAIEKSYAAWREASQELANWQQKAEAYGEIQQQRRPHELRLESERSRLNQRKIELTKGAMTIQEMAGRRTSLAQSLEEMNGRLEQLSLALAEVAAKETALQEAKRELQKIQATRDLQMQEQSQLAAQLAKVDARRNEKEAVVTTQKEAQDALSRINEQLAFLAEEIGRLSDIKGEIAALQAEQPRLREHMNRLEGRIKQLEEDSGGQCPVCGQDLDDDHRLAVISELKAEGTTYGDKWRQNRATLEALAAEFSSLDTKGDDQKRLERERSTQQQRLATATARLEEIDKAISSWSSESQARLDELNQAIGDDSSLRAQGAAVSELAAATEIGPALKAEREALLARVSTAEANIVQIDEMTSQWQSKNDDDGAGSHAELVRIAGLLEANQISAEDQRALDELAIKAAEINYDSEKHQVVKKKAEALAESEQRYQELTRAQAALKPLEDGLGDLEKRLADQQAALSEIGRQHDEAAATLEGLTEGVDDLAEVENRVQELREQQIEAHRREETAQQNVKVLGDLSNQRDELAGERAELTQLIRRLQLLEKACGREGVQALLIERALPEIEDDANELLDRLSGGQMQITFDTQRKLKTSDRLAETLDISIVDSAGERPYENYSGGEQFRVNFAVRLALSKILARRAGARLQTLVIDEGFGSQDPAGRQRLIEAINTVQDDFERVLVITHIDEMRDAFPNRIEVEKGPQGSSVQVV